MSYWTLHHINVSNPQYNPSSLYNAILEASINAVSVIEMSLLHHKNVYSNPQYNPTSLCRNAEPVTYRCKWGPLDQTEIKEKEYHPPGQHHVALADRATS